MEQQTVQEKPSPKKNCKGFATRFCEIRFNRIYPCS